MTGSGKSRACTSIVMLALVTAGCNSSQEHANTGQDTWQTYRQGIFTPDNPFYSQFGAAPFELAATFPVASQRNTMPDIKPGDRIRYRIMDVNGKQLVMTAYMEKLRPGTARDAGDWAFTATDSNNQPMNPGDSCVNCHRQQASNHFLFSLPARP